MTNPHVAFQSSETLHTKTDAFIRDMQGGASKPQPKEIEEIMAIFIDEALQAFMLRASEAANLSSGMLKVVNMTCSTISKATAALVAESEATRIIEPQVQAILKADLDTDKTPVRLLH